MAKFKNKVIASLLTGTMLLGTVSGLIISTESTKVVYAESKALKDARAKVKHLINSMKSSYLGIKNQGTWRTYWTEAHALIKKIPKSEQKYVEGLKDDLLACDQLINTLASINQIEKSMETNYLGIKNAEMWNKYLKIADYHLSLVGYFTEEGFHDTGEKGWSFEKQYAELFSRRNKVEATIKSIEEDFIIKYNNVVTLFNEAKASNDKEKAKIALSEAEKLGSCTRSDNLENEIKIFINN